MRQPVGTLLIDFDSTLISCESLEVILAGRGLDAKIAAQIRRITEMGMAGNLSFKDSLIRRLRLAAPTLRDIRAFAAAAQSWLTPGMADLVADLRDRGVDIRIGSGAIRDAIMPLAAILGIPNDNVHAVEALWHEDGRFAGLKPGCAFAQSKAAGIAKLVGGWPRPCVAVGDGMTDLALLRTGLVQHFIAFTQHVRREGILADGSPEAGNALQLRKRLERIFGPLVAE